MRPALGAAELIVNATSVGFGSDEMPFDPAVLHPEQLVADLVYHPLDTPCCAPPAMPGRAAVDGLGHARPPGRPAAAAVARHGSPTSA